jgi:hypothetical protein
VEPGPVQKSALKPGSRRPKHEWRSDHGAGLRHYPAALRWVFLFGVAMMSANDSIATGIAPLLLIVGAVILSLMALLFWIAFRHRRPRGTQS